MITYTYREIEIVLLEEENKWRFTANGRERSAPTLPKAREYIDNALDEVATKKVKAWEPFFAWTNEGYNHTWRKVKVTSQADRGYSGTTEFWITDPTATDRFGKIKPERSKVSEVYLYQDSPQNVALISEIQTIHKQREELDEQRRVKERGLKRIKVPKAKE